MRTTLTKSEDAMTLYKTTLVIWSEANPSNMTISELASELVDDDGFGSTYCSKRLSELTASPKTDPDWESTEFFDRADEDQE